MEVDNPDVYEGDYGTTYTGQAAGQVFQMIQQQWFSQNSSQQPDPNKEIKDDILHGNYQDALNKILNNNPWLTNFLSANYFDLIPGTSKNMQDAVNDGGETWNTSTTDRKYVTIMINESVLDAFANNKDEYDYVLQTIFHEEVHGKQDLSLDGFTNHGNKAENEFEAYYYEAHNTSMKLSAYNQSWEYGWFPTNYLLGVYGAATLAGNKPADLIQKHLQEIQYLLTRVSSAAAANIRKKITAQTGINL
jgi:hypothetical protein